LPFFGLGAATGYFGDQPAGKIAERFLHQLQPWRPNEQAEMECDLGLAIGSC